MTDYQFSHVPLNRQPKKRTVRTPEAKVTAAIDRYLKKIGAQPTEVVNKAPGLWWLGPIGA